ncbi:MAG TPA: cytochrome c biogenesis protein CcdA, partial [Cyclobacteriaceae bacterium]|nr:cytochrome c biogenesis protein CcdA [Cyclobacteriaceae bacterium]
MIKRFFSTSLFFLIISGSAIAQILTPAKWTWQPSSINVKVGDEIDLIFKATIDKDWYMYANDFDPECGPILTTVTLTPDASFKVIGTLKAINPKPKHDEVFDCDVKIFEKTGEFRQKIKVLSANLKLSGTYDGQVCTSVDGKCIGFDGDFEFTGIAVTGGEKKTESKKEEIKFEITTPVVIDSAKKSEPATIEKTETEIKGPTLDESILEGESTFGNDSFWSLLVLAFIAGLTSLITPCVFPMIPMTVTFFLKDTQTKREGIKKAIIFGLSIIILYSSAGTLFAIILGPEGLNALATNWALNLFIFLVFIIFALSFFGLFEITAPYQLVNKVDQKAEKGGLVGVFFMAFTLVLISFSCTVPIVGSVLALSAGGQVLKPILMMFSYSLAFALPFTFFAFFPEMIKSMPKSGGWLNAVKVTLGFLELALALKFFSIADQAYHWGLLDRDVNIALWVVIFTLLGFYLLGKIRLPHDSVLEKIPVARLLLAIGVFTFVIYLIPGLWGAPLKALAGYLPPQYTNDFDLVTLTRNTRENEICEQPKYADFLHLPHGLQGYFDYEQAVKCAREQNKPLFIDFTGHGCTNCREMEAVVWSDPAVLERLKNDFVVVALYVDDKTTLPESEWYTSKYDNKVKKTIGKQNADLQITNLDNNAQPFYVLLGTDERVLAWPYGYNRSVEEFVKFLEKGK